MNLYKLILVDDEEEVRKSIIKKIDWKSLGFDLVADAENGEDALEKIEIYEPDVVMTDIKMPYMDGLTLIEKVSSKNPSIKFVIFSGFDDFEYAKEAIKLSVSEYILKPVDSEELSKIFYKIKKSLDKEIEERNDIEKLRRNYLVNLPLLKNQFLNNLINSKLSKDEISLRLKEYELNLEGAKEYISLAIDIEYENANIKANLGLQKELLSLSVIDFLRDRLEKFYRFSIFSSLVDNKVLGIVAIDKKFSKNNLLNLLRAICKDSTRLLGLNISVGIGNVEKNIENLAGSYKLALDALGYKQIMGIGEPIYIEDVEPIVSDILYFDDKETEEFSLAIKFGDEDRIKNINNNIIIKLKEAKVHIRQKQAYILNIINILIRIMQKYELSLNIFDNIKEYLEIHNNKEDIEKFSIWLNDICINIYNKIKDNRENTSKKVIEEAKAFILENYMKEEMNVDLVCKYLHMSTAYFSTLFKKEVGKTCIAYITDLKLEKALELLNTTDYKTYMIASMVGYTEQNYFSYVFKKKYGISPSKYRNQVKEN